MGNVVSRVLGEVSWPEPYPNVIWRCVGANSCCANSTTWGTSVCRLSFSATISAICSSKMVFCYPDTYLPHMATCQRA